MYILLMIAAAIYLYYDLSETDAGRTEAIDRAYRERNR